MSNKAIKQAIWERLTSDADALDLDYRIDERPADVFAVRAAKGERPEIVTSLRCLLVEIVTGVLESNPTEVARFLRNALPLCDSLAAVECKSALKQILLLDNPSDWEGNLPEIQELASRALVGIPKEEADFRFWADIAQKANSCLPYALNAAVEIDLDKGMDLVCNTCCRCMDEQTIDTVDWTVVFELAIDSYGEGKVERSLHRSCTRYGVKADNLQEYLAYEVAKRAGLSHRGKKGLDEIASEGHLFDALLSGRSRRTKDVDALVMDKDYESLLRARAKKNSDFVEEIEKVYSGRIGVKSPAQDWFAYGNAAEALR